MFNRYADLVHRRFSRAILIPLLCALSMPAHAQGNAAQDPLASEDGRKFLQAIYDN